MQVIVVVAFVVTVLWTGRDSSAEAQVVIRLPDQDRVFRGEVSSDMMILDALNASVLAGNIPLTFMIDESTDSTIITRLDGHGIGDTMMFYVNAKPINAEKIHSIPLQPQDVVTVKVF